jgi:hypothetical protein
MPPPLGRTARIPLTSADVPRYLLRRGLVDASTIVDGDLVVRDVSSRNRNFRVESSDGSFLLKQGLTQDAAVAVANEAWVYRRLTREPELSTVMPRFYTFDSENGVLTLELVSHAQDLRAYHSSRGYFSTRLAAATGSALGTLHRLTQLHATRSVAPELAPRILGLHRPDNGIFREVSSASLDLIRLVQREVSLTQSLDDLRATWRPQSVIHYDVKWDNVIAYRKSRVGPVTGIKLVDWEAACAGEPSWDIGSALSQYLSFWLFSIPVTGYTQPDQFPQLARHPLQKMQGAIISCWRAYARQLHADHNFEHQLLLRAVQFAGARLLQTAFEATQATEQLTGNLALHAQLSQNILDRPGEAAVHLLGIPIPYPSAP